MPSGAKRCAKYADRKYVAALLMLYRSITASATFPAVNCATSTPPAGARTVPRLPTQTTRTLSCFSCAAVLFSSGSSKVVSRNGPTACTPMHSSVPWAVTLPGGGARTPALWKRTSRRGAEERSARSRSRLYRVPVEEGCAARMEEMVVSALVAERQARWTVALEL